MIDAKPGKLYRLVTKYHWGGRTEMDALVWYRGYSEYAERYYFLAITGTHTGYITLRFNEMGKRHRYVLKPL